MDRTAYNRQWARNNSEKRKAASRRCYRRAMKNPIRRAKIRANRKAWRLAHKHQVCVYSQKWRHRNDPPTRPKPKWCELKCGRRATDHDHTPGKFRGWLCRYCNWGLGHFKDDPALLIRAAHYLRRHRCKQRKRRDIQPSPRR